MPVLHLGVTEIPYANPPRANRRHKSLPKAGTQTTGDVAGWLENRYHVMEVFANERGPDIGDALAESVKDAAEAIMQGAPATLDPFGDATNAIKTAFDQFVTSKEMDKLGYPGVPTKASLMGVNHRFKGKRGTPGRPSFLDTGLFLSSFRAWVT